MLGLMQDWPLLCHRIIDHAAIYHGERKVITRSVEGPIVRDQLRRDPRRARSRWRSGWRRTASSSATGWRRWPGTPGGTWRPGTASWASARSTTRSTRGCSPTRSCWIVNHAEDRMMFIDLTFVPLLEKIADKLPTIERYVILTDAAHMPQTTLKNAVAYEDWIGGGRRRFRMARSSTRTPPPACATPPAPPAIPRACSTRTAPTCCTP